MDNNLVPQINSWLDKIEVSYRIDCESEQIRKDIIDCITSAGIKAEGYFRIFKNITAEIKRGHGHKFGDCKVPELDVGPGEIMSVLYREKKVEKKERFEIFKIVIGEQHYSRLMLLNRYSIVSRKS